MTSEQKNYRLGQLVIKPELGEFEKNGEPVHLDPILMAILVHLIQAAPDIVSSEELLDQFWNNTVVEESTIHRRISQLRQALGDNARNPIYIATIPKRGYRIIANTSLWNEDNKTSNSNIGKPVTEDQLVSAAKRFTPAKVLVSLLIIAVTGLFSHSVFFDDSGVTNEKQKKKSVVSPSIAVLPFQDFSESANNSHLVSGFHDDIIMKLAQINNLRVISRTSVNRYSNGISHSVPNIAEELGVSHIIEGSLRRTDNQIKFTIQLIDGSKDKHIWGATYERNLENLFSIHSEIAQQIASILAIESPIVKSLRFDKAPTNNLPAYELVLRGRELINVGTVKSLEKASTFMAQAIAVDPLLAEAHAGYARSLFLQTFLGVQWYQVRERSLLASEKALELDPQSASIHTNYAHIRSVWDRDEETAMHHYQKALELEPNNSFSLLHFGAHLSIQRDRPAEALPLLERAMILDQV
jgi:TolB-like protein/DNA-binding winged helix-turn-helix (wHTH) protein